MSKQSRDKVELAQKIDAYLKGKLSEDEVDTLWIELLKRPDYLEYLKTEAALKDLIAERSGHDMVQSEPPKGPAYRPWLSIAAAVVLIIASVVVFRLVNQQSPATLAPDQIDVNELASADVMRSSTDEIKKIDSLLNLGFESAVSGKTDKARQIFSDIIHNYSDEPTRAMAYLNLGILRYNNHDFSEAAASFRKAGQFAENDSITKQKAGWFLANTYLKNGKEHEAKMLLQQISGSKGLYATNAGHLLGEMEQN